MLKKSMVMAIAVFVLFSVVSCDGSSPAPSAGKSENEFYFSLIKSSSGISESENYSAISSGSEASEESGESITMSTTDSAIGSGSKASEGSSGSISMSTIESQIPESNAINADDPRIRYFGRTYYDDRFDACFFNWTNSGFIISFTGTRLSAVFFTDQSLPDKNKPHIKVYVDDKEAVEMTISKNDRFILAEDLDDGNHTVRIVKINESLLNKLSVRSLELNSGGIFNTPAPLPERRIEYIGDSITCGYGNIPPYDFPELTASIQDGTRTYGYFISEYFKTDSRYICVSGAPVYRNYLGNVGDFFKRYSWNDYNDDLLYDFAGWIPDLVIINLGTNDVGSGSTYAEFISNGKKWIDFIRTNYPDAFIIWTYGVMNQQNIARIREIVTYYNDHGDSKVYFHELAPMDTVTDGTGSGGHPTYKTHRKMADGLIPVIKDKMNW